jgi:hypothetical protein
LKEYRDDILYPVSFDEAGAKEHMRPFFDVAEMQAKGTPAGELKKLIQERYKTGYYKAPERTGVSYMMAPILRTYVNPDANEEVATTNIPHVMHYAPNLSEADLGVAPPSAEQLNHYSHHGGWKENPDPFLINHGPHAYFIQFLGLKERDAINKEYADMLSRLCKFYAAFCIPH